MGANWFFGISPNAFGAIGALVNFGVAYAVSKVTAPPPEHIQHLVEDIRVPKGGGRGHRPLRSPIHRSAIWKPRQKRGFLSQDHQGPSQDPPA